ncbi:MULTISPECIES: N-formylglutamate deformylase [unclassified Bosea (in: a-proteobacteria)]|uniref:N-formylglutamate deformylase n=1 Tax=unclassified Bosea (in: a-proteobacteria) TaxID=2653178 RepID=UPI0019D10465|nr:MULTISPECIES: N-formylglutamate deformylase [unclassified Bosea (in: a-proteobacteria)]
MSAEIVSVTRGSSPLVLSMPHPGTGLPAEVAAQLNARGSQVEDTDWHMRQLYAFAERFQPTIVEAGLSRFVIDLNRDPAGISLYPGQATTELVPITTFDGAPIWQTAPDEAEIARRREAYFQPYHAALAAEIEHAKAQYGFCLLWDCHSIKSVIPRLFPGTLPTLNLGTNSGVSAAPSVEAAAATAMAGSAFSQVVNGRFKGGWITRHYGRPAEHVHALQMEIALSAYLDNETTPWTFAPAKAASLQATLSAMIEAALAAATQLERSKP